MDQRFDRIERFTRDLLRAAEQDELVIASPPHALRVERLSDVVKKILAYEEELRGIERHDPSALDACLTRDGFARYARRGTSAPRRGFVPAPRSADRDGEEEEEAAFAGLRDLAQRDPEFYEAILADLRRGATKAGLLYVEVLDERCRAFPRPSYREIGERRGLDPGTLRVGVLRLRAKAQRAVLRRLHGRSGAELGDGALEELGRAWREDRQDDLASSLEALRTGHDRDPLWRLHAGNAAFRAGRVAEAGLHWVFGLVVAHEGGLRAKILSNLGCAEHAAGRREQARAHWLAASGLDPRAPFPLLNLAMHYVETGAAFYWSWCLKQLSPLRAEPESRGTIDAFLTECPAFAAISRTSEWRRGPAKWVREREARRAEAAAGFRLPTFPRPGAAGGRPRLRRAA